SPANHDLNRHVVAQPAKVIADAAGIKVPADTVLLMAEENGGFGNEFPFTGEKLSPVAGIRKCKDFEDGLAKMMSILDYQGKGHSVGIHTSIPERVTIMGETIPVCKVAVNQAQSLVNSGSWTCGFPISMTLGCGTWGHNSISHNATWKDLLNFTYVSRPIPSFQPSDEDLFDADIVKAFK
ncbi:MAG: aldehyde dehydrogenase, partial [Anaerovorax sp.]